MSKLNSHIKSFICENSDGYFAALLENGSVRIGLLGNECFDFPASHAEFNRCNDLSNETVEDTYDEFYGRYCCI